MFGGVHSATGVGIAIMTEPVSKAASSSAPAGSQLEGSLFSEVLRMASVYWASRERKRLLMLGAGNLFVIAATARLQVRLNAWNQPFYDAVTRKDLADFVHELGVFAILAAVLLILNVAQIWLALSTKLTLRRSLVHDLFDHWLEPARAFRLSKAGSIGVNPDQRLSADAQHLTELATDLLIGLTQSTLLLLSFIGVLWVLSETMVMPFGGRHVHVPGYMVWCALLYAAAASFLSWRVGRPLIALNAERYAREADLRFALVRTNEDIEGITIYGGEAGAKQFLNRIFDTVLSVVQRIVGATTRLTWITSGYGWFTIVAPILVAAPSYLSSAMSFGQLMMVIGAFNQVQASLRWFVDNFSMLADWRATRRRVASFRAALVTMDRLDKSGDRIDLKESTGRSIRFDDLCVATPDGSIRLSEKHVELAPGERTLILGEKGGSGTFLLNALIGIWPWGHGQITRPRREAMMFLPARAYVPPGTLRAALAYPQPEDGFKDDDLHHALAEVGLEHLQSLLETSDRWDRRLSEDEKQRLAFARALLLRPQWLVVYGALDELDPPTRERIEALLAGSLSDVSLIDIGKDAAPEGFFKRKLRLVTDSRGETFRPADHCEMTVA
jgi:putative ATP-binding cassette transporter